MRANAFRNPGRKRLLRQPPAPRRGRFALKGTTWTRQDQRHCAAVRHSVRSRSFRSALRAYRLFRYRFANAPHLPALRFTSALLRYAHPRLRKIATLPLTPTLSNPLLRTLRSQRLHAFGTLLFSPPHSPRQRRATRRSTPQAGNAGEPPRAARRGMTKVNYSATISPSSRNSERISRRGFIIAPTVDTTPFGNIHSK